MAWDQAKDLPGLRGWRHLALDATGSTNDDAMAAARDGEPGGLWVTAKIQESGRGRRGRTWQSPSGNLYASMMLIDPAPNDRLVTLPLAVSVALHRAISMACPAAAHALSIKWPNDILLEGRKIAGFLLEVTSLAPNKIAVVVGCGINCAWHPDEAAYPTTSLQARGHAIDAEMLFAYLAKAMASTLAEWDQGRGFPDTRDAWLIRASGVGEKVVARFEKEELSGTFSHLDDEGRLVLNGDDGKEYRISAGDIFLGSVVPMRQSKS